MKNIINLYLLEYAIGSLLRQKSKNIFITIILTLLTFLLTSVFFITSSIRYELDKTVEALPQIIVSQNVGGKHYDIDTDKVDAILGITGVTTAIPRVWGYYYFKNAGVNFTLVGVDEFEPTYKKSLQNVVKDFDKLDDGILIGIGVRKTLTKSYFKDYFNFILSDGTIKKMDIKGDFSGDTELESNDMIVMSKDNLRKIFDMDDNKATDIVVSVSNPDEVQTVASKIQLLFPNTRIITKNDLKISYQNIFDYKSGVFLALFIISLFTFFIIIYDKASGLTSEQTREIGILKAIGFKIDDILKEKFYEGVIISLFAYIIGVFLSFAFVYIFNAPLLQDIFTGYSELKTSFNLPFILDTQTLVIVFFLSVPIYISATIIPSWRIATMEAQEVMR